MSIKHHHLINNLDGNPKNGSFSLPVAIVIILISVIVGGSIGYFLSKSGSTPTTTSSSSSESAKAASGAKKSAGIQDAKAFPDKAEGTLKEGGIEDEGSFHLERPGGLSQNVYLTSSTVDLTEFIGKKVRVWGQTNTAKKAGWLMDVGYIEVL